MAKKTSRFPTFRRYMLTGLLIWVPLGVTFLVVKAIVELLDKLLLILPYKWRPETLLGFDLPGFGIILALTVVFMTGMFLTNFLGKRMVLLWEQLLSHIPVLRSIHTAVKQLINTFFNEDSTSFKQVLLIQYPRVGIWTMAFQSNDDTGEIGEKAGRDLLSIFVPTSPNPTSGLVLMIPREDTIPLDMSVEDGLRMIMSLGVVMPDDLVTDAKSATPLTDQSYKSK